MYIEIKILHMNELTVGHLRDILHMSDTENYNKGGICTVKTMQNTYSKNLCRYDFMYIWIQTDHLHFQRRTETGACYFNNQPAYKECHCGTETATQIKELEL